MILFYEVSDNILMNYLYSCEFYVAIIMSLTGAIKALSPITDLIQSM
jgi:hypothetical protein